MTAKVVHFVRDQDQHLNFGRITIAAGELWCAKMAGHKPPPHLSTMTWSEVTCRRCRHLMDQVERAEEREANARVTARLAEIAAERPCEVCDQLTPRGERHHCDGKLRSAGSLFRVYGARDGSTYEMFEIVEEETLFDWIQVVGSTTKLKGPWHITGMGYEPPHGYTQMFMVNKETRTLIPMHAVTMMKGVME